MQQISNRISSAVINKILKTAKEEILETKKSVENQITGGQINQPEPINWHGNAPDVSPEEKKKIEARGMQNVQALEDEIKMIMRQKEQANSQKLQESLNKAEPAEKVSAPVILPTSKPGRRMQGGGKPKSQTSSAERQKKKD